MKTLKLLIFIISFTIIFASCNKDKSNDDGCYTESKGSVLNNDPQNTVPDSGQTIYHYDCYYGNFSAKIKNNEISYPETLKIEEGTGTHISIFFANNVLNCDISNDFNTIKVVSGTFYVNSTDSYKVLSGAGTRDGNKITINFVYDGIQTPFNTLNISIEAEKM